VRGRGGIEPALAGHADVEEQHVGAQCHRLRHGRWAIADRAHDAQLGPCPSQFGLQRLGEQLDGLGDARALVLVGYDSFFSAGLDLPTLVSLDRREMGAFIDVHSMLLDDAMLVQATIDLIRTRRYNASAKHAACCRLYREWHPRTEASYQVQSGRCGSISWVNPLKIDPQTGNRVPRSVGYG